MVSKSINQTRGFVFPESIYAFVPHLRRISARTEDMVMPFITENETFIEELRGLEDWYDSMMGELESENRGLFLVMKDLRETAKVEDSIWRFIGEWLFALRQEYLQDGRDLPLITSETIQIFQAMIREPNNLLDAMFSKLVIETRSSDVGWCSMVRDTKLRGTQKADMMKALCTIALLLDIAAEYDFTPSGTTPRSIS